MEATINSEHPPLTETHIPSWKRLGLKLKYAKDTHEQSGSIPESHIDNTLNEGNSFKVDKHAKRQRDREHIGDEHSRLLKKGKSCAGPTTKHAFGNQSRDQSHLVAEKRTKEYTRFNVDSNDKQPQRNTSEARRKSVAFTLDTKADDGYSAQHLFKAWASSAGQSKSGHPAQTGATSLTTAPDSAVGKHQRKRQRAASIATPESHLLNDKELSTAESSPEYLTYLIRFHKDKSTWKFNKSKQTALLKNCFNINRIPSTYDSALIAYISGLQGVAAQQRLLSEAEDILQAFLQSQNKSSEIEGMDSVQARQVAYQNALQREIEKVERSWSKRGEHDEQQLEDMKRNIERGKRAEAVLAELLQRSLAANSTSAVPTGNSLPANGNTSLESVNTPGSRQKITKRRKRKARTEILSSDDNSDTSSSSSSSSSSESEDE